MTPAIAVQIAQGMAALAWGTVMLHRAPAVLRLWRKRGDIDDVTRALVAFVGLTQIGFTVRWYLYPHTLPAMDTGELSLWLALYTTSTVNALALLAAGIARGRILT